MFLSIAKSLGGGGNVDKVMLLCTNFDFYFKFSNVLIFNMFFLIVHAGVFTQCLGTALYPYSSQKIGNNMWPIYVFNMVEKKAANLQIKYNLHLL